MKHGVIHTKDGRRTYIKTHSKHIDTHDHAKHILPGKHKHKILPVKYKKHHDEFSVGDKVLYEIHKIDNSLLVALYFSLPMIGAIIGLIMGKIFAHSQPGIILYMFLFMVLGVAIKFALWKDFAVFKEIEVRIHKVDNNSDVKVKSVKKNTKKKATKKKASKKKTTKKAVKKAAKKQTKKRTSKKK